MFTKVSEASVDEHDKCAALPRRPNASEGSRTLCQQEARVASFMHDSKTDSSTDRFRELEEKDVVAPGEHPWELQMPSPVYCVECIDDDYIILAAGGGGRRFGMINAVVLLGVHTSSDADARQQSHANTSERNSSTCAHKPGQPMRRAASDPSVSVAESTTADQLSTHDDRANPISVGVAATMSDRPNMKPDTDPHNSYMNDTRPNSSPFWHFAGALDLGNDVPWCASKYLPYSEHHDTADRDATAISKTKTAKEIQDDDEAAEEVDVTLWTEKQRRTLNALHGFFAISSVSTFTLLGIYQTDTRVVDPTNAVTTERHQEQSNKLEDNSSNSKKATHLQTGTAVPPRYTLRRLACVSIPQDALNADKKPIALVKHALIVADDDRNIRIYSLPSLVADEGAVTLSVIKTNSQSNISPLALWSLPGRVNDLHANRINLVRTRIRSKRPAEQTLTRTPPLHCTALILDYVIIAAALQDKTVRITLYQQRRRSLRATHMDSKSTKAGSEKLSNQLAPTDDASSSAQQLRQQDNVRDNTNYTFDTTQLQPIRVYDATVLSGAMCGLPFNLMPSSIRLVRLFALEDETPREVRRQRHELVQRRLILCGIKKNRPSEKINGARKTQSSSQNVELAELHEYNISADDPIGETTSHENNNSKLCMMPTDKHGDMCASLVVVAYDCKSNQSYMVELQIFANLPLSREEVKTSYRLGASSQDILDVDKSEQHIIDEKKEKADCNITPTLVISRTKVPIDAILSDCITCISASRMTERRSTNKDKRLRHYETHSTTQKNQSSLPSVTQSSTIAEAHLEDSHTIQSQSSVSNGIKPALCTYKNRMKSSVPNSWIVGTVEGSLAMIDRDDNARPYTLRYIRPSTSISASKRKPPLHKEPISSIVVTNAQEVVSTDIAQHVVISTLTDTCIKYTIIKNNKTYIKTENLSTFQTNTQHDTKLKASITYLMQQITKQISTCVVRVTFRSILLLIIILLAIYANDNWSSKIYNKK